MSRMLPLFALLALVAGCASGEGVRATPATFDEFLAEVEAEMDSSLAGLDDGDRSQLEDLFPVVASQVTWQGVLDVLSNRPAFLPLSRRMSRVIERRGDARIDREVTTPSGNRALKDLLIESISAYLSPAAAG
ncbi:MAG: hypothetical protein ACREMK_14240 [Gemmatimonadota bacterium]